MKAIKEKIKRKTRKRESKPSGLNTITFGSWFW